MNDAGFTRSPLCLTPGNADVAQFLPRGGLALSLVRIVVDIAVETFKILGGKRARELILVT